MHPFASSQPIRRALGGTWCLLLFLTVPVTTHAQTGDEVWIGAGLGLGTLFDDDGEDDFGGALAGVLYASYRSDVHVFSLRTAASGEWLFGDNFLDVGLLYGRARSSPSGHASLSVGLAVVIGERRCDGFLFVCSTEDGVELVDETERVVTVGFPVEAQLFWRLSSFVGLGFYGFANINPEAPFIGATVGFQLGDFR